MINTITNTQIQILESLAKFFYLTPDQMVALNIVGSRNNIYSHLTKLKKYKFIKEITFGVDKNKGKLPSLYSLKNKGQEFLVNELDYFIDEIKRPQRATLSSRLLDHTQLMVDFHISLIKTLKKHSDEYDFFYYDFEKENKISKTKIFLDRKEKPAIKADMIFKHKKTLYLVEIHRGKGTKRALRQIKYHLLALGSGKYSERFDFQDWKLLYVLNENNYINRVIERFSSEPIIKKRLDKIKNKILLKPSDQITWIEKNKYNNKKIISNDLFKNWSNLIDEKFFLNNQKGL